MKFNGSKKTTKITTGVNTKAIIAVLVFSGLIATFNETILNVDLSPLTAEFNVTAGTIQWIITAYMIVVAVLVPVTAFLIQTFKTKQLFLAAMGILLIGTICGACSGSFAMLLISRIIQAAGTGMMTVFTMSVMLPMFVQGALGASSFVAAMTLLPATLISGFLTPVAGKLYDKIGPKIVLPIGFAIILIPLFILAHANSNTSLMTIIMLFIIVDIGIALTMSPSQTTALSPLPREYYPHGVAILNTLQQLSAAIGSSLFIGIMSATQLKALSNQVQEQTATAAEVVNAEVIEA